MIGKLTGRYGGSAGDGAILIEVGGVGYCVRVPLATLADAAMREGDQVEFYIYTAVREDAIDLYGFRTRDELSFFKLLTSVSGVGPKTALGILTVADVPSLRRAVASGDATILSKVYGVGKKSAERIVVELRDKLAREEALEGRSTSAGMPIDAEVLEALESLGYSAAESRRAIQAIPGEISGVKERLSAALRQLGTPTQKL